MSSNLDLKDRKILYQLDINARQSFSQIGKKVGLSKEVVNYRVRNLMRKGIIKNFFSIIDVAKLGYLSFRIYLRFQNTTTKKEEEIIEHIKNQKNTGWIVSVKGIWNINFVVWYKTIEEFNTFWRDFLEKYKKYLIDYEVSILTKLKHYRRAYLLNKNKDFSEEVTLGERKDIRLDETDFEILKKISENAKKSSLKISEEINKSEKIVRDRIKKLLNQKIILGFRALLDLNKLGYRYYKLHLELNSFDKKTINSLLNFSHRHPNIIYYTETIGGKDFELDIQARDNNELFKIINEFKDNFPKTIRNFEFMQYDNEYKLVYLPEGQQEQTNI